MPWINAKASPFEALAGGGGDTVTPPLVSRDTEFKQHVAFCKYKFRICCLRAREMVSRCTVFPTASEVVKRTR